MFHNSSQKLPTISSLFKKRSITDANSFLPSNWNGGSESKAKRHKTRNVPSEGVTLYVENDDEDWVVKFTKEEWAQARMFPYFRALENIYTGPNDPIIIDSLSNDDHPNTLLVWPLIKQIISNKPWDIPINYSWDLYYMIQQLGLDTNAFYEKFRQWFKPTLKPPPVIHNTSETLDEVKTGVDDDYGFVHMDLETKTTSEPCVGFFTWDGFLQMKHLIEGPYKTYGLNISTLFTLPSMMNQESYMTFGDKLLAAKEWDLLYQWSLPIQHISTCNLPIPAHLFSWLKTVSSGMIAWDEKTWPEGVAWAGGSLVAAYHNMDVHTLKEDFDIDLWTFDEKVTFALLKHFEKFNPYYVVNQSVIDVIIPNYPFKFQIIYSGQRKNVLELVRNFDVDYVRALYDTDGLFAFPECLRAWDTRKITKTNHPRPIRLLKAVEKGFQVDSPPALSNKQLRRRWRYFRPNSDHKEENVLEILQSISPLSTVVRTVKEVEAVFKGIPFEDGWSQYKKTPLTLEEYHNQPSLSLLEPSFSNKTKTNCQIIYFQHPLQFTLKRVVCFPVKSYSVDTKYDSDSNGNLQVMVEDEKFGHLMNVMYNRVINELSQNCANYFYSLSTVIKDQLMHYFARPLKVKKHNSEQQLYKNRIMSIKLQKDHPPTIYDERTEEFGTGSGGYADISILAVENLYPVISVEGEIYGLWFFHGQQIGGFCIRATNIIYHESITQV